MTSLSTTTSRFTRNCSSDVESAPSMATSRSSRSPAQSRTNRSDPDHARVGASLQEHRRRRRALAAARADGRGVAAAERHAHELGAVARVTASASADGCCSTAVAPPSTSVRRPAEEMSVELPASSTTAVVPTAVMVASDVASSPSIPLVVGSPGAPVGVDRDRDEFAPGGRDGVHGPVDADRDIGALAQLGQGVGHPRTWNEPMPFAGTTQRSPDARSSTATVWAPSTTFASPGTSAASVMPTIAGSTLRDRRVGVVDHQHGRAGLQHVVVVGRGAQAPVEHAGLVVEVADEQALLLRHPDAAVVQVDLGGREALVDERHRRDGDGRHGDHGCRRRGHDGAREATQTTS